MLATMAMTELAPREAGFSISPTDDLSQPEGEALFGLHNRDYPALWALSRLAEMANEEPIPVTDYHARVLQEAWDFGKRLLAIEKRTGRKCTALFPTNPDKRQSAEARFWMFAVGAFRIGGDNTITTSGPLFEWRTVSLGGSVDEPRISLTAAGWQLLTALRGLSVEEPHAPASAAAFLTHLQEHAPADRRGFIEIMRAIGPDGATRQNVLDHAGTRWPEWNKNKVSTNAAGYIARAREWGPRRTEAIQVSLSPHAVWPRTTHGRKEMTTNNKKIVEQALRCPHAGGSHCGSGSHRLGHRGASPAPARRPLEQPGDPDRVGL